MALATSADPTEKLPSPSACSQDRVFAPFGEGEALANAHAIRAFEGAATIIDRVRPRERSPFRLRPDGDTGASSQQC